VDQPSTEQASRRRVALGGVLVDRVDRRGADVRIAAFLDDGGSHQITTVNTDFLRTAKADPSFRTIINGSDLAVADGMPVVWLSRLVRRPIPERVTGFDLIDSSCRHALRTGIGVFLLGAAPGVADAAATELQRRYPGLRIAGTYSPPFGDDRAGEEARMVAAVRAGGRAVLLVAFGAPKQDRFIREHIGELDIPVAVGVGCAFDVLSGAIRRAPRWMQHVGLEWVWRFMMEPARLWRRYLIDDIPFLGSLAATLVRDGRGAQGEVA
jgi:N-acetylglucosaminyldiphosphoundecaprenol N-acetyl-beta-D-mannosaminyltransferase